MKLDSKYHIKYDPMHMKCPELANLQRQEAGAGDRGKWGVTEWV